MIRSILQSTFSGGTALTSSMVQLGMRPGTDVHTEADVELACWEQVRDRRQRAQIGRALGLRLCQRRGWALRGQHRLHLVSELNHGLTAEEVLIWPHPGPDTLHDGCRSVIAMVSIEVAADAILSGLRGHCDGHIDVVVPLEDFDFDAKGKRHVH
eukprot:CAMPEP_0115411062 /NCGR_PEP_ID=MMETSP0271-20121206/20838_1 /TAXON_ID=71861 /ORGANISM="Scrippsiella trochoidea, Strain CCMP3099" /LENGTH=154 /DNA_ID=CAMNT_0002835253 /DNA_START=205 /DNA_END=665 /DNA_ORIENTATION=-